MALATFAPSYGARCEGEPCAALEVEEHLDLVVVIRIDSGYLVVDALLLVAHAIEIGS